MSGWPNDLFVGRRFAVVGLGRNGLPAATTLAAMGAEVVAWDDKTLPSWSHDTLPPLLPLPSGRGPG